MGKKLVSLVLTALSALGCANSNEKILQPLYQEEMPKSALPFISWGKLQLRRPKTNEETLVLLKRIPYVREKTDRWNSPKRTLKLGYRDCDDGAILGAWSQESQGYLPQVLVVKDKIGVHIMTLLEKKIDVTRYGMIDYPNLLEPVYSSIENLVRGINKIQKTEYTHYAVIHLDSLREDWRTTDEDLRRDMVIRLTSVYE